MKIVLTAREGPTAYLRFPPEHHHCIRHSKLHRTHLRCFASDIEHLPEVLQWRPNHCELVTINGASEMIADRRAHFIWEAFFLLRTVGRGLPHLGVSAGLAVE
jgi:hypothetical protein